VAFASSDRPVGQKLSTPNGILIALDEGDAGGPQNVDDFLHRPARELSAAPLHADQGLDRVAQVLQ
jgi:hypothetical protein